MDKKAEARSVRSLMLTLEMAKELPDGYPADWPQAFIYIAVNEKGGHTGYYAIRNSNGVPEAHELECPVLLGAVIKAYKAGYPVTHELTGRSKRMISLHGFMIERGKAAVQAIAA